MKVELKFVCTKQNGDYVFESADGRWTLEVPKNSKTESLSGWIQITISQED